MKIRGNTIGTPMKPDKILVKAQNLTEEQKRQARKNIGALGGDDDCLEMLTIAGQDQDSETVIYSGGSTGDRNAILRFDGAQYANAPVLRGIADGVEYQDAATFGQLDRQRESLADYVGDFATDNVVWYSETQNLTEEQQRRARYNIGAISNNDEVSALNFTSKLSTDDGANVQFNGNILHGTGTPEVDTDAANKGYVDGLVGDIEAALDTIIAYQNDIINGYITPTALNDEGGDGV